MSFTNPESISTGDKSHYKRDLKVIPYLFNDFSTCRGAEGHALCPKCVRLSDDKSVGKDGNTFLTVPATSRTTCGPFLAERRVKFYDPEQGEKNEQ